MTKQEGKTYFYVETKQEARRRTISIWQEEIDDESLVQEGKKNEYGTQIFNKHRSKNRLRWCRFGGVTVWIW
jgi:hypothetical protein